MDSLSFSSHLKFTAVHVIISVVALLLLRWLFSSLKSRGPWGVPILGYYPFLRKDFYVHLHEMSKKYGDPYVINLMGQSYLHVSTWAVLKEVHVSKTDCFPDRGQKAGILHDSLAHGLAYLEGEHWRVQRKFFVQAMRTIGLTKTNENTKGPVLDAVQSTLETLDSSLKKNEPVEIFPLLTKQCTDVVVHLILGDDVGEDRINQLNEAYTKILLPMTGLNFCLVGDVANFLLMSRDPGYISMMEGRKDMVDLLMQIINEHKAKFDSEQPARDFIDMYLLEKATREKKGDPQAKFFTDLDLASTLIQAYGDGSVSIGAFAGLFIREFCLNPEVQDAVYDQIIQVVGTERLPTWEDRTNLTVLVSALKEFLRINSMLYAFPTLECSKDTTVMDVDVPKGCVVLVNIWAINQDPAVYENPEKFDLNRYSADKPKTEPLTFGIGRRACAGEALVMSECFAFVSGILQNFKLTTVRDDVKDSDKVFEDAMKFSLKVEPRPGSKYSST